MKKSLLALSILGAFAGVAQAQTNVTMYGIADVGLVRNDDGKAKVTKLDSGVYSGSRLGFKGTEDLGGGLQGLFTLETGINVDTGGFDQEQTISGVKNGGTAFGRQAFVGLGGNFGSVKLGRQQTFIFFAQAGIDPFGIGLAGNSTKFFSGPLRVNNTIKYESPNISGFTAGYSHSFGEVVGAASNGTDNAFTVQYNNGPIFLSAIYDQSNSSPQTASILPGVIASTPDLTTANLKTKVTNIGGTYDFGVAKAHLMFDRVRGDSTIATPGANYRDYLVGVSVPFGASTFLADYMKRTDKAFVSRDAKQYAIGYTYSMSKRTTLYTSYSRTTNDSDVALSGAAAKGLTDKNFDVGVRHAF